MVFDDYEKGHKQSILLPVKVKNVGTVETEFLNGEVVRLPKKLGKTAPINEGLMRISQDMAAKREIPGKYTPEQLRKIWGCNQ